MPANRGRQNLSIIAEEKPSASNRSAVVTSGRRNRARTGWVRTSTTNRANRALSAIDPIGAAIVLGIPRGRRSGSLTWWNRSPARILAPGSK